MIAYGPPAARVPAVHHLFYYWPQLNPSLVDKRGIHHKYSGELIVSYDRHHINLAAAIYVGALFCPAPRLATAYCAGLLLDAALSSLFTLIYRAHNHIYSIRKYLYGFIFTTTNVLSFILGFEFIGKLFLVFAC